MKMPAGGAHSGGSQQTGFEMELMTAASSKAIFGQWPNFQRSKLGMSWEARTMEECESVLCFEESLAGWGIGNLKPAPPPTGSKEHRAVLMVAPPITVTFQIRQDRTTMLTVRAPLVIYTEEDATILPPDDKDGVPFYQDPPDSPGMHRDLFRMHAKKIISTMVEESWPLSKRLAMLAS